MAVGMLVAELVHKELLLALWKKTLVDKFTYKTIIIETCNGCREASVK